LDRWRQSLRKPILGTKADLHPSRRDIGLTVSNLPDSRRSMDGSELLQTEKLENPLCKRRDAGCSSGPDVQYCPTRDSLCQCGEGCSYHVSDEDERSEEHTSELQSRFDIV